ncbi:MAG: hypothetical protein GY838_19390 [bacterium]|nr:hypothetical protein [bacterium]
MFHLASFRNTGTSAAATLRACLVLTTLILFALPAAAEVPRVENGAAPANGLVTASLQELWRAGGEDDEVFFGNVGRVTTDPQGNVVILDGQLSEAHVYDRDGEHQATVGKEGDGPGEVRRPNDAFVMADGTVCLLQGFPGKVIKLTADGLPAGDATFSAGAATQGQFGVLVRGLPHPQGMVLAGIQMTFGGGSQSDQNYFFSLCDAEAVEQVSLSSKQHTIDYADLVMDEAAMDFVWNRVAVDVSGLIHVIPGRNDYAIHVFAADGAPVRIVTREYVPLPRDEARRDVARRIIEGIAANYPAPAREITIEDSEQDITGMWALDNGELWVQTSRGDAEPPAGAWTVLDVFDENGKFTRQLALPGGHDPLKDALHVLPDGRLVVVAGALEAFLNQMAVAGDEDAGAEEATPLEVICYEMTN